MDPRHALDGRTILLIDSNPQSRRLIGGLLRDHGCTSLHQGEHGRDALDLLDVTAGRLDLLICAVALRGPSGLAVVQALRLGRTRGRPDTPAALFHPQADETLAQLVDRLDAGISFGLPVAGDWLCLRLAEVIARPVPARMRAPAYADIPLAWAPRTPVATPAPSGLTAREAALAAERMLAAELCGTAAAAIPPRPLS